MLITTWVLLLDYPVKLILLERGMGILWQLGNRSRDDVLCIVALCFLIISVGKWDKYKV